VLSVLLRAAPWRGLLALSAAGAATGGTAVAMHSGPASRMLELTLALLGGAAACALDEPSAVVTAPCPVARWRQVLVRALTASVPLAAGAVLVATWAARGSLDRLLVLQLAGCCLLGFALATMARTWVDEPAELVVPGLVLSLLSVMFVEPVGRRLVLFPDDAQLDRGVRTWWVVLVCCGVSLVLAVRERRWR